MVSTQAAASAPAATVASKGVEVHDEQVDRLDVVRQHRRFVLGVLAHREEATVHLGMQGLHAPVHHLGEPGQVGDLRDGQAGVGKHPLRAAGRNERDAVRRQSLGELDEAGLVGDR